MITTYFGIFRIKWGRWEYTSSIHVFLCTMFSVRSVKILYKEEQLWLRSSFLETVQWRWVRVGGRCEMVASLRVSSAESWDGSQKNRKLDVNVNMEAEDIDEDTEDWEDFVPALVNCIVSELEIAVQLLVVKICKCSINLVTKPSLV
jgi:hypothetical protein